MMVLVATVSGHQPKSVALSYSPLSLAIEGPSVPSSRGLCLIPPTNVYQPPPMCWKLCTLGSGTLGPVRVSSSYTLGKQILEGSWVAGRY